MPNIKYAVHNYWHSGIDQTTQESRLLVQEMKVNCMKYRKDGADENKF